MATPLYQYVPFALCKLKMGAFQHVSRRWEQVAISGKTQIISLKLGNTRIFLN